MNNNRNLTTCRYNENGKCTNEGERKECVEVAEKNLFKECINNLCKYNANLKCYDKEQEKQCPKQITKELVKKLSYWE